MQALEFTNEKHQEKILRLNQEINGLIANKHVARRGCLTTYYVSSKKQQRSSLILCYSMSVQAAGKT